MEFSEGITAIGSQAFNGCGKLTDVVLPSSLESIGAYAFSANTSLKELTFSGDAPAIGNNAFAKVTASMYYPGKNLTWDDSILQNYGGNLTWLEKDGEEIPDDTIPEEPPVPIPEEDSLTDESVPEEIETEAAVPEETIAETVIPEVTDPDTVPEETTADSSEPDPDTVPEDTTADSSEPDSDTVPEDTTVAPSAPDETVPEITATEETVPENTTSDDALSEEMTGETSDTVESDSEICVLENNTDSATVSGETTQEAEWVESSASAVPEDDLTYTEILSNGEPCDPTDFTYLDTLAETVSPVEKEENTEAIWTTSSEEADYGSDLAAGDRPDDIEEQVKPSEQSAYESNLPDGSDGSGQKDPAESMESAQTETAEESDDKSDLVDADIQVNAAEPEEAVWTESMEATVPTLEAIYAGEYDSETSELYTLRKAHFSGLAVGKQYVMLALQAVDSDAPVGSDNLLYITQGVSDEEGKLSFEYIQRMDTEFSYVVACGASHKDLHNGLVIFPEMYADGTSRVISPRVTYEGKTLTEGKDYCLAGTVGYCEPGDYICYVRGIRDYTGLVECKYHVKEYKMVQQIQLDVEKVQLLPGESAVLNAEVLPVDATDNTIIWSSSDESVAKVDQTGRITAVTEGNAMITATAGDGSGVSASCALTVSLKTELMILSQPVDCAGALNSQASFTIAVNKEDVSYQWYYSTNNGETWLKSGSTGSDTDTLTVQIKEYRLGQLYRCEVTDSEGNVLTSDSATMMLPPSTIEIVSHPADVYGRSAETIPITVEATGEGLTYRWYYSNNAGKDWDVSWSEGYNTETLYPVLRTYNSGRLFKCLITDANGNKEWTEAAMMALDSSDIVITTQPVSYEGAVNDLTTFTVAAEGVNLEYSWYVSQNNGETWARSYNTGYNTPELQVRLHAYRTGFQYKCQITSGGVTVKETDVVTISLRPSTAKITKQPLNAGAEENQYVTFHVEATGNALQYQWEYSNNGGESWGNSTAADAMTDTFRVQVRQYRDGYRYRCKITDDSGRSIYSDTVTLRMGAMPGITSQPANHTGAAGETAVFTVEATGENLSYQWEYSNNGGATWSSSGASGCKTNRLSIGLAAHRNGQMYRCVITNEYGSVISDAATMTVS